MRGFRAVIVGGGFSGIGAAIRLYQSGVDDLVILERSSAAGGTWHHNHYPGAACDIRSHLYSFSFAPNPDWSRSYSPQSEIETYLNACLDRFGLRDRFRPDHEVIEARWDHSEQEWFLETTQGSYRAPLLVWATGPLSEPNVPELPGMSKFDGQLFHSADWRHDVDLAGRRVAVVGTGASAIQFVPRIQPVVERLYLHQRTPPWVLPRRDHAIASWKRQLYRAVPPLQRALRAGIYMQQELLVPVMMGKPRARATVEGLARRYLAAQVADPALRDKLTPRYALGCKRVLVSDDYYPALVQPNVELVGAAAELREDAVVDVDGVARQVDAVILATGFNASEPSFATRIVGRQGLRLSDAWREGMAAYLGTMVAGFPNMFLLLGPNTVLGHNSVLVMLESQLAFMEDFLRHSRRLGFASADVRPGVQALFNLSLQRRLSHMVWSTGGCGSWYLDRHGRNTTLWPGYTMDYWRRSRRFHPSEFVVRRAGDQELVYP